MCIVEQGERRHERAISRGSSPETVVTLFLPAVQFYLITLEMEGDEKGF